MLLPLLLSIQLLLAKLAVILHPVLHFVLLFLHESFTVRGLEFLGRLSALQVMSVKLHQTVSVFKSHMLCMLFVLIFIVQAYLHQQIRLILQTSEILLDPLIQPLDLILGVSDGSSVQALNALLKNLIARIINFSWIFFKHFKLLMTIPLHMVIKWIKLFVPNSL